MPIKYRYKISDGTNDVGCFPLYQSASMTTDLETDQVFHRTKFSGSMTFIGEAASYIIASDIESRFEVQQQKYNFTTGQYGDTVWTGEFWKTDCKIDEDENTVEVQPQTVDQYTALMKGLNKEYDLLALNPKITPVQIKKQPIFQVYIPGEAYLTNYVGTTYWEQPVSEITTLGATLTGTYFFNLGDTRFYIPGHNLDPSGVSGVYSFNGGTGDYDGGNYTVRWNATANRWEILDTLNSYALVMYGTTAEADEFATVFTPVSGLGTNTQLFQRDFYVRMLTNAATIDGNPTDPIPVSDIIPSNPNYTTVIGVDTINFQFSSNVTTTPTRYGKADEDCENIDSSELYFNKPTGTPAGEAAIPLSRTNWSCFATWFYFDDDLRDWQGFGSEDVLIKHCYSLFDVLDALINEIDPNINVSAAASNTAFYYNQFNPIDTLANPIYFLTPKSNILVGDYDLPANKAKIKLKELLDSLWTIHRVKWFVDSDYEFKVEHIKYFDNGGSYSTEVIGTDIAAYNEPQTDKPWGYKQNTYTYEKQQMPERFEYTWMDDVSFPFEGYPIDVNSRYIEDGLIKTEQVPNITTDIDFMFADPTRIAERGFAFMYATSVLGVYTVPFYEFTLNDETHKIQNGKLCNYYLHPNFHKYNLPAPDIEVNDNTTTADSVNRTKVQTVVFASDLSHDPMTLITTLLGTGKVKTITEDLNDSQKTLTVYHDTQ